MLHGWEYGSLIFDVIGMKDSKIRVEVDGKGKNCILVIEYDLDLSKDDFWAKNRCIPFPYVAEDIEKELNEWKADYEKMGHKQNNSN